MNTTEILLAFLAYLLILFAGSEVATINFGVFLILLLALVGVDIDYIESWE